MTETQTLISKLDSFPYPASMVMVKGEIPGLAFFPGGKGIYNPKDETISNKKVMIVGQDFDSETSYQISRLQGKEDEQKNPTWRNLLKLLDETGIRREDCFFTNGIMGVRKDDKSTGRSPAFKDESFLKNCRDFFLLQVDLQKPKVILVLGTYTAKFLSALSPKLECWKSVKPFTRIDAEKNHVIKDVIFSNDKKSNMVLLTHPSFRPANIGRRSFVGAEAGNPSEIAMIKSVL